MMSDAQGGVSKQSFYGGYFAPKAKARPPKEPKEGPAEESSNARLNREIIVKRSGSEILA